MSPINGFSICLNIQLDLLLFFCSVLKFLDFIFKVFLKIRNDIPTSLSDDHRALEPPDPIPNSEVKRCIADGSLGGPMRE